MRSTIWENLIFIKILFLIHFSGKSSKKRTFSENNPDFWCVFFLEKRTQNQGYYHNLEFFRLFLYEVHNLDKSHIYQDFISETPFWEKHQKNALFRKISHNLGAFFF